MGRVEPRAVRPASAGPGALRHHKQLIDTVKPTYKVILEEVTQVKKALKIEESHNLNPPKGYKFLPAGDPVLTSKCKELSRLDGKKVYAVINTTAEKTELSKQVHRIGFHFPSEVIQRALTSLGIDLELEDEVLRRLLDVGPEREQRKGARTRTIKNAKVSNRNGKANQNQHGLNVAEMSQEEIDAQAKAAILDMFPAIPEDNLYRIILHAFEKGTDRVGVQLSGLSLPRRVQLAVVAHIRHVYTDYDNLLSTHGWHGARGAVGQKTLEVLASWRGDLDDDPGALEDILREVIIISDDEDEPSSSTAQTATAQAYRPVNTQQQELLPATIYESRSDQIDSGRSQKVRQIWLNAREHRKEPIAAPRDRVDSSYGLHPSDHAFSEYFNQQAYQNRLKGLERYPRRIVEEQRVIGSNRYPATTHNHSQDHTLRQPAMPQQENRDGYANCFDVRTPERPSRSRGTKLSLLPITDEVLPSIETPRTERAPTSIGPRGAIVIDSPPLPKRLDFSHIRRDHGTDSPSKRPRQPSPDVPIRSRPRDVIYLPIREDRNSNRREYAHSQAIEAPSHDQVVYLPLSANGGTQAAYNHNHEILATHRAASQIYIDSPHRSDRYATNQQYPRYEYIPLDSMQQRGGQGSMTRDMDSPRKRLIPFNNSQSIPGQRSYVENGQHGQLLMPLHTPHHDAPQRPAAEFEISRQDVAPLQHGENAVLREPRQYELFTYSPRDPHARIPQQYRGHERMNSSTM